MVQRLWTSCGSLLVVALMIMSASSFTGCASDAPPPDRSSQEIKSDSDRMFEKMKQEERERAKGTEGTPR
jgi:hypothetical protein